MAARPPGARGPEAGVPPACANRDLRKDATTTNTRPLKSPIGSGCNWTCAHLRRAGKAAGRVDMAVWRPELGHNTVDESGPLCQCGSRWRRRRCQHPAILRLLRDHLGAELEDLLRLLCESDTAALAWSNTPAGTSARRSRSFATSSTRGSFSSAETWAPWPKRYSIRSEVRRNTIMRPWNSRVGDEPAAVAASGESVAPTLLSLARSSNKMFRVAALMTRTGTFARRSQLS